MTIKALTRVEISFVLSLSLVSTHQISHAFHRFAGSPSSSSWSDIISPPQPSALERTLIGAGLLNPYPTRGQRLAEKLITPTNIVLAGATSYLLLNKYLWNHYDAVNKRYAKIIGIWDRSIANPPVGNWAQGEFLESLIKEIRAINGQQIKDLATATDFDSFIKNLSQSKSSLDSMLNSLLKIGPLRTMIEKLQKRLGNILEYVKHNKDNLILFDQMNRQQRPYPPQHQSPSQRYFPQGIPSQEPPHISMQPIERIAYQPPDPIRPLAPSSLVTLPQREVEPQRETPQRTLEVPSAGNVLYNWASERVRSLTPSWLSFGGSTSSTHPTRQATVPAVD